MSITGLKLCEAFNITKDQKKWTSNTLDP